MDTRWPHYDPATGHMCFSNALLCLKRGRTVTRASAGEHPWQLKIIDGHIFSFSPYGVMCSWHPRSGDLLAEDWVEVV